MRLNLIKFISSCFVSLLILFTTGAVHAASPNQPLAEGIQNYNSQRYTAAVSNFSEAIKADPNNIEVYRMRGLALARATDFSNAVSDFTHVINLEPENPTNYYWRGVMWVQTGHTDRAIADFDKTTSLTTNFVRAYVFRGWAYFETTNYSKALDDENEAIRLDPKDDEAFYYRSRIFARQSDFLKASNDISIAIKLEPKNPKYHGLRAEIRLSQKDYDGAISDSDTAILLSPKLAHPTETYLYNFLIRGIAYGYKSNYVSAIQNFDEIISRKPDDTMALGNRGFAFAQTGDYRRGIADCKKAVALTPDNSNAQNNLAWQLAVCPDPQLRDGAEAVAHAKKACDLTHWKEADCLGTLAAAYAETGNFVEAVKWQKKRIKIGLPEDVAAEAREQLKLYEEKRPYHATKATP